MVIIPEGVLVILSGQVHAALHESENKEVSSEQLQASDFYDPELLTKFIGLPMLIGFFIMLLFDVLAKAFVHSSEKDTRQNQEHISKSIAAKNLADYSNDEESKLIEVGENKRKCCHFGLLFAINITFP